MIYIADTQDSGFVAWIVAMKSAPHVTTALSESDEHGSALCSMSGGRLCRQKWMMSRETNNVFPGSSHVWHLRHPRGPAHFAERR